MCFIQVVTRLYETLLNNRAASKLHLYLYQCLYKCIILKRR